VESSFQQHEKSTHSLLLPPSLFSELVYVYKLVYSSVYKNLLQLLSTASAAVHVVPMQSCKLAQVYHDLETLVAIHQGDVV